MLIRQQQAASEPAQASVLIEGSEQRGYVARIEVARGASAGERELRGAGCAAVADAAVLIIAMAIDPEGASASAAVQRQAELQTSASSEATADDAANARPEGSSAGPQSGEAPPEQETALERPAEPREPENAGEPPRGRRDAARVALGLHAVGDAGSLPRATVGAGLFGGVHWQRLRLELQALAYLPQIGEPSPVPASAEVSLYTGALGACWHLLGARDEPQALGACTVIEAGLSRGAPLDISDGQPRAGFWLASFLGVDVQQRLAGPLHLRLLAEVGLPVLRPSYEIEPFGRVFRASPVLGRFGISAFVLFP